MSLQAEQLEQPLMDAIGDSIEHGWQMPARFYCDPQMHEIEQAAIFKKAWLCVGREAGLVNPGDYLTAQLGEVPIFVVRGEDGRLYGHVNACRHRLHPVALGESGCQRLFQCRYHGWTFTPEGALRSGPGLEHCPQSEKDRLGLIPIQIATFRGFIFANADSDAPTLETWLENAGELLDSLNIDLNDWDFSGTLTYDVDADWKLFSENSLECYHCPLVHQNTFATHFGTQPQDYITREFANVLSQHAPCSLGPEGYDLQSLKGFRFVFVWPSTYISVDDFVGTVARIIPIGPQRTRFCVDTFVRPGSDPAVIEKWLDVYDKTFEEDKVVVTAQQAGYQSGMIGQGRLMPYREASIQMFQRRTWAALKQDPRLFSPGNPGSQLPAPLPRVPVVSVAAGLASAEQDSPWDAELRIHSLEPAAEGVAVLALEPMGDSPLPAWEPGAHIELVLPNGLVRQYSLCGDPRDNRRWRIGVLRDPQSRGGSAFVHEQLRVGSRVRVRGPRNHFPLPQADAYRFVAGGIGITPILAMLRQCDAQGKPWSLLYGGRSRGSMAFLQELQGFGDRVRIVPKDSHGLLDLASFLDGAPANTVVCACGPEPLLAALADVCAGQANLALHTERFAPAPSDPTDNTEFQLVLAKSGRRLRVPKDRTILQVVREAGLEIYSSCENGVCGTCETTVIEGTPDHRDSLLSAGERAQNKSMLICVSRCKSDKLILDL